jgi:alginate O-acetyltransferase complex protein AlgI
VIFISLRGLRVKSVETNMSVEQMGWVVQAALQVLVPFRVLLAIALGAIAYWLLPRAWRPAGLIVISLAVVLFGYERSWLLVAGTATTCALVYAAVKRRVNAKVIVAGLVTFYVLLHLAFGLLTFTPWLGFTGLTPEFVLPTIGLTAAFTLLRLVHFTVDYSGRDAATPLPHPRTFAAWCLFFPTFVHLPLIRYPKWAAQYECLPAAHWRWMDTRAGALRIGQALLKGVFVAVIYIALNPQGILLNPASASALQLFFAAIASAISYYIGFSAYMDLGIGAARLMGIALPENFAPVLAMLRINRMRDFWRNWNITTTQWLNDYVYRPLGGHRRHPLRNVMLTMVVCGLWHSVSLWGAGWGAGLGALLLIEHGWNRMRIRRNWPEVPPAARTVLLLCGISFVNLFLTPYGYHAQFGAFLYPPRWLGIGL